MQSMIGVTLEILFDGVWRILQHDKPDDYILAAGESHTVRGFVEITLDAVEITIAWKGPRGIWSLNMSQY